MHKLRSMRTDTATQSALRVAVLWRHVADARVRTTVRLAESTAGRTSNATPQGSGSGRCAAIARRSRGIKRCSHHARLPQDTENHHSIGRRLVVSVCTQGSANIASLTMAQRFDEQRAIVNAQVAHLYPGNAFEVRDNAPRAQQQQQRQCTIRLVRSHVQKYCSALSVTPTTK